MHLLASQDFLNINRIALLTLLGTVPCLLDHVCFYGSTVCVAPRVPEIDGNTWICLLKFQVLQCLPHGKHSECTEIGSVKLYSLPPVAKVWSIPSSCVLVMTSSLASSASPFCTLTSDQRINRNISLAHPCGFGLGTFLQCRSCSFRINNATF